MEKRLRNSLNEDQAEFESKVIQGRRFSDLQKYLKSSHKSSRYPETMKYKDAQTNEDNKNCAFFSEFFSKVFLKTNQIKKKSFDKHLHNKFEIDKSEIKEILSKLQTNKACGPDRIGNTVLKNLPALSKPLFLIFKTALNKGFLPSYWKISEVVPIFKDQNRALIEQ